MPGVHQCRRSNLNRGSMDTPLGPERPSRSRRDCTDCLETFQNGTSQGCRTSTVRSTCKCRIHWRSPAVESVQQNTVSSLSNLDTIGPSFSRPLGRTLNFGIEIAKSKNFSYSLLFSSSASSSLIGTIGRVPTIITPGRLDVPHCGSTPNANQRNRNLWVPCQSWML